MQNTGMKSPLNKLLFSFATIALIAFSTVTHGLEIGEISVHSKLNEPLKAIIPISGTSEELQMLNVVLANDQRFEEAGFILHPLLDTLRFKVIANEDASHITITSVVNIREPLLDFILDIRSDNGRIIKEYSLLLSP